MTATLTAPRSHRPNVVLMAVAALAAIAFTVVLIASLASGSDSPAKDQAPTATTQVSGSSSDVTSSPDSVDRAADPSATGSPDSIDRAADEAEPQAKPSRAF